MKNNKSNIRTGVIGIGSMGQNHARVYSEISNLVAIADPNSEQGKLVSERLGTTWVEDYSQILDKVDAVSISVPTSLLVVNIGGMGAILAIALRYTQLYLVLQKQASYIYIYIYMTQR